LNGRTTRHLVYAVSQRLRKRVGEIFGWMKTVGNLRKTRHRGEDRVGWVFTLTAAVYNLVRIRNLTAAISLGPEKTLTADRLIAHDGLRRLFLFPLFQEFPRESH